MNNNLIAVAIGVTVGMISAVSIFIYRKILANQQYSTTVSDLNTANKRIDELQSELEALRLQLRQQKKKRKISRKLNSSDNTYTLTDNEATDIDVFSTDTDIGDDEFYDCSDGDSETELRISEELNQLEVILKEIDEQERKGESDVDTYHKLRTLVNSHNHQDDVEIVWRFARACYNRAEAQTDKNVKRAFIVEGIQSCEKVIDVRNLNLYKWYAILVGLNGDYLSVSDRIKNGVVFKNYVEMALEMRPDDSELQYLLGRFKYEIANLSWIEKKVAATLFAELPCVTHEEALACFEKAVELGSKNPYAQLYVSKCYAALKEYARAIDTLNGILDKPKAEMETVDDEKVHAEASKLHKKYSGYIS